MGQARPSYEFGPFRLDLSEQVLFRDGRPLPLTPKLFDVLCVLVQNHGHLVEKERLLREVWPDAFVEEGALNRSVSLLRKALGDTPAGQRYIQTAPKRGYRFVAPVTVRSTECQTFGTSSGLPAVGSDARPTDSPSLHTIWLPVAMRTRNAMRAAGISGALLTVGVLYYSFARPLESSKNPTTTVPVHRQLTFTGRAGFPTLSPDGKRVAYVSGENPERKLIVQELAGGPPLAIYAAQDIGHVRWSPDGSALIVWSRDAAGKGGVSVLPQLGGVPQKIMDDRYIACWAPDGETIAVGSYHDGRIWLLNAGGQLQSTMTLQGARRSISDLDWSPSNGRLLFVSDDGQGSHTIGTIRPDGSDQRIVVREDTEVPVARWGPGGNAIYYFRRLNQTFALNKAVVEVDDHAGGAVVNSLLTGLEPDGSLGLSADGARLVYGRTPYYSNLWLLESRGDGDARHREPRQLTHGTSRLERPRVSPDGTSIVVNVGYQSATELYTLPLTGGTLKRLTFLNAFSVGGAWSPDGRSIAFASTKGGFPGIWIVAAGGGVPRAVPSADLSDGMDLTWSPGPRILYQQKGNQNYKALDPDTGAEHPLTQGNSPSWMFFPVHSADGTQVAVQWNRPSKRGIWVIGLKNRSMAVAYESSASVTPLGWSADGRSVYVVEGRPFKGRDFSSPLAETTTDGRILMVPVQGGKVTTVLSIPFEEFGGVAMTPDAKRFVVTVYSSLSDVWMVDNFDGSPGSMHARR